MQNCIRIPSEFPGFVQSERQQSWNFFETERGRGRGLRTKNWTYITQIVPC
jgi:hypothetical protein